jgi:cyclin-dependent kinase 12/13
MFALTLDTFLPNTSKFVPEKSKPRRLREYLMKETQSRKRIFPKGALELIDNLLALDPEQRMSTKDALKSFFFQTRPFVPETMGPITNLPPSHEYQTKKIRKEQAKGNLQAGSHAGPNTNSNPGGTDTGATASAAPIASCCTNDDNKNLENSSPKEISTDVNETLPSSIHKEEENNKRKREEE